MSHPVLKKKLLASCVAAACSASMSMTAQAQGGVDEEVVVFGIRGALQRSADIKREATGVVDAITAEDIGKFPDTNLAESLQRISGVSIDRRNGEGYQVTVRGFGPQFNLVTLNGRSMPTSNLNLGKSSGSNPSTARSFDMSNLAAEGVSGVEVYKTSRADIASGGIGASVNLKTRRPFDTEGFSATVGLKAINDTTNRVGDDVTPELSTFVSWSDDMFGASFAYTKQERHSGQSGVFTNSWSAYSGPWTNAGFIEGVPYTPGVSDPPGTPSIAVGDVNVVNAPSVGQQTNLTPGIRYYHEDHERTRENMQLTLQFRPMDNLTATLDYTKAEQDLLLNGAEFSFWFGGGSFPATDVQFDGNSQVATPIYFWTENPTGVVRDLGLTQNYGDVKNELKSTGLNLEFVASDQLTLSLDYHNSESSSLPGSGDIIGSYFNIATGAQGVWAQGYDNSGDLPLLLGVYMDDHRDGSGNFGQVEDELDIGDVGSTVRQGWWSRAWGEIDQLRLDGKYQLSDELSIDFGVESSSLEATQKASFLQEVLEGNWGVSTPGDVPPEMMSELNFASLFDGYRTTLTPEGQAFFDQAGLAGTSSGSQAQVFTRGFIADNVKDLGKLLSANAGLDWAPNPNDGTNRTIKEDITAFYVQGSYKMDVGAMPLDILAGIRHEKTDVESLGQVGVTSILWQGDNDMITQTGAAADAPLTRGKGDYSHTLPSLSLSLGITDSLIGRFAYSKTIARASYNNLLEGINGIQPPNGGPTILGAAPGTAQNGNPGLNPLESKNLDLSLEWYYGEASYVSVGYFKKDVPNFVGTAVEDQVVPTTLDPTNGPRAEDAIQALTDAGIQVNQQNLFRMIASMSQEGVGCTTSFGAGENNTNSASCGADFFDYDYEGADGWEDNVDLTAVTGDPNYIARVSFPIDNRSAELDGWELAVQHFFGDTGFGAQANYTIVDGDISFDITGAPGTTQFALTGLSDSANLVLIYEDDKWSTRLAYNWRDNFLVATADAANEPRHTEDYSQIDLSVGYNVNDNLALSFEAINLTGEDARDYARTERQLLNIGILDTRYALGLRYTFE
jgi:TonB-dependent receptor